MQGPTQAMQGNRTRAVAAIPEVAEASGASILARLLELRRAPPGGLPADRTEWVNRPQTAQELEALRRGIARGVPFGREEWVKRIAREWGLESTLRPRGRPRKAKEGS